MEKWELKHPNGLQKAECQTKEFEIYLVGIGGATGKF